jgi:hypothetical protein
VSGAERSETAKFSRAGHSKTVEFSRALFSIGSEDGGLFVWLGLTTVGGCKGSFNACLESV